MALVRAASRYKDGCCGVCRAGLELQAISIDSAIREAVEAERRAGEAAMLEMVKLRRVEAAEAMRERCCRAVTRLYKNDDGYGGSTHDRTVHRCELAIRALPLEEA
jgi:hypothetical protein